MRVKGGFTTRRRHKKVLKLAKGYQHGLHKRFRLAKEALLKALSYSYVHRKDRKGDFRSLWITRINAAVREYGISYSQFIAGLKKCEIDINRKLLSDIALNDKESFNILIEKSKEALGIKV